MGRKLKYATEEARIAARRARQMIYYARNAERIKQRNLKRYYEKLSKMPNS